MEKKKLNNKVEISACGKSITMRLSDEELKKLRIYSNTKKGENLNTKTIGDIYNFSLYALFDMDLKSRSKASRIHENFPYHNFSTAFWCLL